MPRAAPAALGTLIAGRYRLEQLLGEGGMGAVFRAQQVSLRRTVAIKVLRAELASNPTITRRFIAEAEAVAKLNHPNTVGIYDFGQQPDGTLFIAMEFVDGVSLRSELTRQGALDLARSVTIAHHIAASLADAHLAGIVHRDLKPDNVMLSVRGARRDEVRVLDFGIAKLRDANARTAMTQAGDVLGTPLYMAPEQINGGSIDARTDVYALGAMLYEMLTGRLVFEAPNVLGILAKHLTEPIIAPRARRPDLMLPAWVDDVCATALAKLPQQRFDSMEAFAAMLAACHPQTTPAALGIALGPVAATPNPAPNDVAQAAHRSALTSATGPAAAPAAMPLTSPAPDALALAGAAPSSATPLPPPAAPLRATPPFHADASAQPARHQPRKSTGKRAAVIGGTSLAAAMVAGVLLARDRSASTPSGQAAGTTADRQRRDDNAQPADPWHATSTNAPLGSHVTVATDSVAPPSARQLVAGADPWAGAPTVEPAAEPAAQATATDAAFEFTPPPQALGPQRDNEGSNRSYLWLVGTDLMISILVAPTLVGGFAANPTAALQQLGESLRFHTDGQSQHSLAGNTYSVAEWHHNSPGSVELLARATVLPSVAGPVVLFVTWRAEAAPAGRALFDDIVSTRLRVHTQ